MAHSSLMSLFRLKCHFTALLCNSCSYKLAKRCFVTSCCFHRQKASSTQWLNRQQNDPFVRRAKQENWRCRSAFKLLEIDEKCRLLNPGYTVIDCGAAPGSWTQVAVSKCGSAVKTITPSLLWMTRCTVALGLRPRATVHRVNHSTSWVIVLTVAQKESEPGTTAGKVIGVDLQHIQPIEGAVLFDKSDFTSPDTQARILEELDGQLADVVLSDMAPNASGTPSLDHDVIIQLCLSVLQFCTVVLKSNGSVVCKLWMGSDQKKLKSVLERMFRKVKNVKPEASRSDSAEIFLIGQEYRLRKT